MGQASSNPESAELSAAITADNIAGARRLLHRAPDLMGARLDIHGSTPIHAAVLQRRHRFIVYLLSYGSRYEVGIFPGAEGVHPCRTECGSCRPCQSQPV